MNKISILIVDNNYRFIKSAINFLSNFDHTHPVGGAMSCKIAMDMIKSYLPDIIILDQTMVSSENKKFLEQINLISPSSKIIITGLDDFPEYKEASLAEGAEAFLPKPEFGSEIIPLILSITN